MATEKSSISEEKGLFIEDGDIVANHAQRSLSLPTVLEKKWAEREPALPVLTAAPTPMEMIRIAVEKNYDLDKLEKLMALERQWKADLAKEAFEDAMAAFKKEPIHVTKDKVNTQYKSFYTSLGNLVGTVTPFLSKHGLSAKWEIDQSLPPAITVSCVITHRLGHSQKPISFTSPPDKSGAKNPIQEIKSAITYAKVVTFESACGLASSDANVDDDGNGVSGDGRPAKLDNLSERLDWIANCKDLTELRNVFTDAYGAAHKLGDNDAIKALTKAKDRRKSELEPAKGR